MAAATCSGLAPASSADSARRTSTTVASFRDALGHLLDSAIADGSWSAGDAERIARMVTSGNALRAYGLADVGDVADPAG